MGVSATIKAVEDVASAHADEGLLDVSTLLRLIPEEELALGEFLTLCLGRPYGL